MLDAYLTRKPGDFMATFWIGRTAAVSGKQLDRGEQALHTVLAAPGVGTDLNPKFEPARKALRELK